MISVIVPVFNKEKCLKRCIDSITAQTYTDFEMILVDDGSTDASLAVCNEMALKYPSITVIHQENQGVSVARNKGMEIAKGEWLAFIDPDDYVERDYLETLMKETDTKGKRPDIVACCCKVELKEGMQVTNYFFDNNYRFTTFAEKKKIILQILNSTYGQPCKTYTAIGVPWGKLYRAELLRKNHLRFLPELKRAQDNIFNLYAVQAAGEIRYVNEPKYIYRAEHILQFDYQYRADYDVIFGSWMKARYDFFQTNSWLEDSDIRKSYMQVSIRNTCKIISKKYLNRAYKTAFRNRIREINNFCKNDYVPCINGRIPTQDLENRKIRLFVWLFNHNQYQFLYFLVNILRKK